MSGLRAIVALLILVVTNVFVFGGVLWNRSGEATGMMVLDQCEVSSFTYWSGRHETPRYMNLHFESQQVDDDSLEDRWYDGERKRLARRIYVVAKHGGPEWQNFVERLERPDRYRADHSKVILVDGGSDPERLLEKYPETKGRAILPGYIGTRYWPGGESKGYRWLSAPISIAIDSRYRGIVKDIRDARLALERAANDNSSGYVSPPCSPTHRITVKWGRRFEPWIHSIEVM